MADPKPESKFEKLTPEEQTAVRWKAERNLSEQQHKGNKFAQNNPDQYLANAREGIASNPDGVREVVEHYKREMNKALEGFKAPKELCDVNPEAAVCAAPKKKGVIQI